MKYSPCDEQEPIMEENRSDAESGDDQAKTNIGSRRALKWGAALVVITMIVGLVGLATMGAMQSTAKDPSGEIENIDAIVQEFLDDEGDDEEDVDQWPPEFFEENSEADEASIEDEDGGRKTQDTMHEGRQLLSSRSSKAYMKYHNQVRCMHKVKLLKWSKKLAKSAQKWANRCKGSMMHSSTKNGENLAWGSNGMTAKGAVKMWYKEIKNTPGGRGRVSGFGGMTGHYTQLVWKKTKSVGCGYSKGLVVCQYSPAGNVYGKFSSNVFSPKRSKNACKKKR